MTELTSATFIAPTGVRGAFASLLLSVSRHRLAAIGLFIIALLCLIAITAPLIAPYSPYDQDLYSVLAGPSRRHWLGTDNLGRDLVSRVIYGTQVSCSSVFPARCCRRSSAWRSDCSRGSREASSIPSSCASPMRSSASRR
jgi:ABC-type dipeptide/oligopeptide/nickel transport system permease subunit